MRRQARGPHYGSGWAEALRRLSLQLKLGASAPPAVLSIGAVLSSLASIVSERGWALAGKGHRRESRRSSVQKERCKNTSGHEGGEGAGALVQILQVLLSLERLYVNPGLVSTGALSTGAL